MKTKLKAALLDILDRAQTTHSMMVHLESEWVASYLTAPEGFGALKEGVETQRAAVVRASKQAMAAGVRCGVAVEQLQTASVVVATMGRIFFRGTEQAPVWERLRATGQGRGRTLAEAAQLERAWESGNAAWIPKPGLTLAAYRELRTTAETTFAACGARADELSVARGILHTQANHLYQACVDWYAVALAMFPPETVNGQMIQSLLSPGRSRKKADTDTAAPGDGAEASSAT